MGKKGSLSRPTRTDEYQLLPLSNSVVKGWSDLQAHQKNKLAEAWDYLSRHPQEFHPERCYPLRGELAKVTRQGKTYDQWQYRNLSRGARIWYFVAEKERAVYITEIFTAHPKATQ